MRFPGFGKRRCWFAALLLPALAAGCSSRGQVSGQVLYKGKPVPGGSVIFRPADARANTVTASLDENGHYEATLPAGEVQIAVDNQELEPQTGERPPRMPLPPGIKLPPGVKPAAPAAPAPSPEAPDKPAGKYVRIPSKYYNVDTSGLTYTVKAGSQTYDIQLK